MASIKISDVLNIKLMGAARAAGVTKDKLAADLLSAALRERRGTPERLTEEPRRERAPGAVSEATFAAQVIAAARRASHAQKFGDDKVFISEVAKNLGVTSRELPAFKRRLAQAHMDGLLSLSRADLVGAMDAAQVDASETEHPGGGGTYNFVRVR